MRRWTGRWLLALALALPLAAMAADASKSPEIAVAVRRDGEAVVVDLNWRVDASPQQAWGVLTDYDHMASFVSSLTASRIVARSGGSLEVAQTRHFGIGLFGLDLDDLREITLTPPREIQSTLIRGDMRASTFTTRLVPEGDGTRIFGHGRFIPDRWIPPLIGTALLESETRKQIAEFRAEILRRLRGAARQAARPSV